MTTSHDGPGFMAAEHVAQEAPRIGYDVLVDDIGHFAKPYTVTNDAESHDSVIALIQDRDFFRVRT